MPITMDDIHEQNKTAKSRFIVVGKKCCIWENERYRSAKVKRYEVFRFSKEGMPLRFPDDTPMFKEYGWDSLEEAKVFYLLHEI